MTASGLTGKIKPASTTSAHSTPPGGPPEMMRFISSADSVGTPKKGPAHGPNGGVMRRSGYADRVAIRKAFSTVSNVHRPRAAGGGTALPGTHKSPGHKL